MSGLMVFVCVFHVFTVVQGELSFSSEDYQHVSDDGYIGDAVWYPPVPSIPEDNQHEHFWDPPGQPQDDPPVEDPGMRLYLTDLIEDGSIDEARTLSRVRGGPFPDDVVSYAGFLTVNRRHNSNLFFWFFEAETDYESAPVILWLQGGPGDSSLIGLFAEIGPFSVAEDDISLVPNPYTWHRNHSVIYIDNPVGAGFSFTDDEEGYANNLSDVSSSLYLALTQFFKLFPELEKNDFFIAGESYAGKYVPALGYTIHNKNRKADFKINLKGIAVGNGFTDPINMIAMSEVACSLGLIDVTTMKQMEVIEKEARRSILEYDMDTALEKTANAFSLFKENSQFNYLYNFMHNTEPPNESKYASFVNRTEVRARLHVGDTRFVFLEGVSSGGPVFDHMTSDYLVSARPYLEKLLDHYHVLYYNGQLDVVIPYSMSVKMYQTLRWSAAEEYKHATRQPWFVNGTLAGYMKSAGNFTEVLVRNAGHQVPADQPAWALDLITRFTSGKIH